MAKRKDLFMKDFEEILKNSERDVRTKVKISRALVDNIDSLIRDWKFAKSAVIKGLENLEAQLENKDPGDLQHSRAPELDKKVAQIIKEISSDFARADIANRDNDTSDELKYLLLATNSITRLLQGHLTGRISHTIAKTYAESLEDSVYRINDLIKCGVE